MRLLITIVITLLLPVLPAKALQVDDFTFFHIGKANGLDNQRIFSICQTSSGAVWWSSLTGVGRYNGSKVKNYPLDAQTPFSHMGGRVIRLSTDSTTVYAFDNRGSIYRFSPLSGSFDIVTRIPEKIGHDVALNDIHIAGKKLYLAMHDGVYLLQGDILKQVVKGPYVNNIVPMANRLLFCAREGVFDEQGHRLLPYNTESGYYDELSRRLWVGGYENGLHLVTIGQNGSVGTDEFVRLTGDAKPQNPIRSICPYDDETILIGIDGEGVYQMSRDGRGPCSMLFDANSTSAGVLHGNGVYCIAVDAWKNIVVGTYSGGIDIARPIGSMTAIYHHIPNNQQSLLNNHVNMVTPLTDDLLMMGTDNGISILNIRTGQWQHSCQGVVALGATRKPDGSVLVSTYGKGVYEMDSHANVRHIYTTNNSALKDDHVYATFHDKDGGLWVGSLNGDLLYKSAAGIHYYPVHDVQAITQLATGQIVVGTAFGLKLITPGNDVVKELNYAPSGVTDVNPFVTHLLASGLELWIATDGGGVYVYHQAKHESRQITTVHGLPSNYVRSLVKGRDGRIWIATDDGLSFVSPDKPDKVVNVNYCYGLDQEFSRGAAQNLSNGDIIFGTTAGAIVMHPENVQSINYTARLTLLGVSCAVNQDELQTEHVYDRLQRGELHLSYDQRTFDLLFESVNMRNHFDIAYRYSIDKGDMSLPTDQQYIRFVSLEPGKHLLTIQCMSRTSGTVIDEKTLTITIAQPWWNSWWMWCVYVALIISAFYVAWRVYQLHEKYMRLTIDHLQVAESVPKFMSQDQMITQQLASEQHELSESSDSLESSEIVHDFVDKATSLIVGHLSDSEFGIDSLFREMSMSRTLFYVKLKSYTGKSPQDFIRIIRLERASSMLRQGRNVTDVAALTGFDNPKYFSTVFKKYFGVSPSKYH